MYQCKPTDINIRQKIPFQQKYMRFLGEDYISALFIIFIECLLQQNEYGKIKSLYEIELYVDQNHLSLIYQSFLRQIFREQITFKQFLEAQKLQDPYNEQSGKFLEKFYNEKTNKYLKMSSLIEFLYDEFDVQIFTAMVFQFQIGQIKIPKDCCAILYQEINRQYSIIQEKQPIGLCCYLCNSVSPNFLQDRAKHIYCLKCLQEQIGYGKDSKNYYTCMICMENISKGELRNLEQKLKLHNDYEDLNFSSQQISQNTSIQCTLCGTKQLQNQMFLTQCQHQICFDCINNAFFNQDEWLRKIRCPHPQCRLIINMEKLEEFFLQKQSEKLQEIDKSESQKKKQQTQDSYQQDIFDYLKEKNQFESQKQKENTIQINHSVQEQIPQQSIQNGGNIYRRRY